LNTNNYTFFNKFPTIKADEFFLREIELYDAKNFLEYMTNPNVVEYLSEEDAPTDYASAIDELSYWRGLFINKRSIYWGIEKDKKLIGTCGYNNWSKTHKRCEISYDLSYDYWSQGIMSKVVSIIVEFAFDKMGVNRVQSTVATDNIGSIKVLERNNFICEGKLSKFGILNGKEKDFYMYSRV